eukprot:1322732-Pyramimonas_sp.AAC.1
MPQYKQGLVSATVVNSIAFYAEQGGRRGMGDISHPPSSAHHAEHLRRAVNARAKSSFYLPRIPV